MIKDGLYQSEEKVATNIVLAPKKLNRFDCAEIVQISVSTGGYGCQTRRTPRTPYSFSGLRVSFHDMSNNTIGSRVRLRRPEISPFWFEVVLAAPHCHDVLVLATRLVALQKEQTSVLTIIQIFLSKRSDPDPVKILGSGYELAKRFRIDRIRIYNTLSIGTDTS